MENIVICVRDEGRQETLARIIAGNSQQDTQFSFFTDAPNLVDHLRYEIPELVVLDISDPDVDYPAILNKVMQDPWLESIAFIVLSEQVTNELLTQYKLYNIVFFLSHREITRAFPKIFMILSRDKQFLYYSSIVEKLTSPSGVFEIYNDIHLVNYYATLFSNYLFKEGYIDINKKYSTYLALSELLINGIEHGNLKITYQQKSRLLAKGYSIQDAIDLKIKKGVAVGERVTLQYKIEREKSTFVITDEGDGFDTSRLPDPTDPSHLAEEHGRGIFLSMTGVDRLSYNDKGNAVTVIVGHNKGKADKKIPLAFHTEKELQFMPGETVFIENERSDSLYYIVSGQYKVILKDKVIAMLNPSNVFLGEMSFLLGNKRSATVKAQTKGKLVEISKMAFTSAIKEHPNYAIFLAKLLAQRLKISNEHRVQGVLL